MKKSVTNPGLKKQILWFVGIYLASIMALGIFHEFSRWLINILK
ncbi:hypothetical protein [Aquella oligotrophica]|nr:hypothetical protein [Aquella oligotrophica]